MSDIGENQWVNAFSAYAFDASTGRLFRGLAHNINGVAQAFSMQTELLQMMFSQANVLLSQLENALSLDEAREISLKLRTLLERRSSLVVHLEREVQVIQKIMQRCSCLVMAINEPAIGLEYSLRSAIETELEFMKGDSFFKHKVKKELNIDENLPLLKGFLVEIHLIIAVLIENAAQSMQVTFSAGQTAPCLVVSASVVESGILLAVSDNGEGVKADTLSRIFEPFYSTRPDHLGIGLWLSKHLAGKFNGVINCESVTGCTTFTLTIPCQGGVDAGCQ